jgi:hypothetical protein
MSKLVDSSTWQYERFVIAYPDEKTLRTGHCIPMNVALPQRSEVASVDANRKSLKESRAPKQQSAGRCGLAWTPNSIRNVSRLGDYFLLLEKHSVCDISGLCLVLVRAESELGRTPRTRSKVFHLQAARSGTADSSCPTIGFCQPPGGVTRSTSFGPQVFGS